MNSNRKTKRMQIVRHCEWCERIFHPWIRTARFCSRECVDTKKRYAWVARFAKHVERRPGCWGWNGTKFQQTGYGAFWLDGQNRGAHVVSMLLYHGSIPPGSFVLHRCGTPECTNPTHLYFGTQRDNIHDQIMSGTFCFGEKNGNAKFTKAQADEIRKEYRETPIGIRGLAKKHGVQRYTIARIVSNVSYV